MSHYNGFNYEEFYEFIIDFFEADQTPGGKAASRELYDWWNRYVFDSIPTFVIINTRSDRCSQCLPLLEQLPRLLQRGSLRLRFYENNAEPVWAPCPLSFFRIIPVFFPLNDNIIAPFMVLPDCANRGILVNPYMATTSTL